MVLVMLQLLQKSLKLTGLLPPIIGLNATVLVPLDRGSPYLSTCVGIYRDFKDSFMIDFSSKLVVFKSLYIELVVSILLIEIAYDKGWFNL